jgi:putrescine importer
MSTLAGTPQQGSLKRTLTLWDLIFYGMIVIQPTAPMGVYGVVSQEARGHVVTAILLAMAAMLLTAISYGRMARVYPSAGSAYTYVTGEFGATAGFVTGWGIVLDYLLNPLICVIWCSKAAGNIIPGGLLPYPVWVTLFAGLFTLLNLRGVEASARTNRRFTLTLTALVVIMMGTMLYYLSGHPPAGWAGYLKPFYDADNFSWSHVSTGTSIAVLSYIGFDSISTLSEEALHPRRDILRATVLTCILAGVISSAEVYIAQLIWPDFQHYPDVDTAYTFVAGRAGGAWLFQLVNAGLLAANVGSGFGAQLGVARLLFGMGRDRAIPERVFGHVNAKTGVPSYNVLISGLLAWVGALTITYGFGAELLNFGAFLAFAGVNAAAFRHYAVRQRNWAPGEWLPPALGALICLYIWFNLHWQALAAGAIWLAIGMSYRILSKWKSLEKSQKSG